MRRIKDNSLIYDTNIREIVLKFLAKIFAFIIDIKTFNTAVRSFVSDLKPSKGLIDIAFMADTIHFGVKGKVILKRNEIITPVVARNLYFVYDITMDYFQRICTLAEGFLIRFGPYAAEGAFFANVFVRDFRG